jgi:UDP-2,3-diacylglucosamine hydrolase
VSAPTLLISDLHLDEARPQATRCLLDLLAGRARGAAALWVLGDLFEAWVGDDDDAPWLVPVLDGFAALSKQVPLHVLHGNRDFLLGAAFCRRTGATLETEPVVLDLHGTRTVLLHGDALCTDDHAYQAFRAQVRRPAWQHGFLAKPLIERRDFAAQARAASQRENSNKDSYLMDVNAGAVAAAFEASGATRMIHGHTHRPARHALEVEGRACERWVLGDWHANGWVASVDAGGCRQEQIAFA